MLSRLIVFVFHMAHRTLLTSCAGWLAQVRGADVTPMQCDLASLASVRSFASEYLQGVGAGAALKLLVCNGGFGDFGGPRYGAFSQYG
jgi:hypothetical protein